MQNTNALFNNLLGNDPLAGKRALDELLQLNVSALPSLFKAAIQAPDRTYHGMDRLATLCAHFGLEAAQFLVDRIESGDWGEQTAAAACFKYIRDRDVFADVAKLAEHSTNFDVQRHAIAALGEAGADGWSRTVYEVVFGKDDNWAPNRYTIEKLAFYAANSLAKMVVKEVNESDVHYDLYWLRQFLKKIWNNGKIKELYPPGEGEIRRAVLGGLRKITSTAATPLIKEYLNREWTFEQVIAAEALYNLPLDRVAAELGKCLLDDSRDSEVRYQCAISLMGFSTLYATQCLQPAVPLYSKTDSEIARGIQWAYSGLFFYEPPSKRASALLSDILSAGGERKAQLIYGYGIWREHPELIEEGLGDSDAFTRAVSALALARSQGESAIPKLRNLWRDAATPLERLFANAALVHAGDKDSQRDLHVQLCNLPVEFREVRLLRLIWKREIISALNSDVPPWTTEAIGWSEVMEVDLERCMEQMAEIASLSPGSISKSARIAQPITPVSTAPVAAQKREPVIFVSYSHENEEWLKRIERVLSPLIQGQALELWTDQQIDPGAKWKQKIEEALARADLALLLVSQPFLASDFISKHELPPLLKRAEEQGVQILWIPVSDSLYTSTEIAAYQAIIDPKRPLDSFRGANLNKKLVEVAKAIALASQKVSKARMS